MKKSKYSKLPKFENGDEYNTSMYSPEDQAALQGNSTTNIYNQRRGANITPNQQYAGYGMAAMNLGSQLSTNQEYTGEQKQMADSQAVNSTADSVAGTTLPWYGAAMGASNMGRGFIKKDEAGKPLTSSGRATDALFKPIHQQQIDAATQGNWGDFIGSTLGAGFYAPIKAKFNSSYKYANGGMNMLPNAEVEKQENSVAPDGEFTQYNGPSHEQGGIPTQLEQGELIFSDKLKLGKKTFAELNKVNNTNRQDKVLENPNADKISKKTAELLRMAKLRNSENLFKQQEDLKQSKLDNYAKRLGISNAGQFKYGGMNKYPNGGTADGEPDLNAYWAAKARGTYQDEGIGYDQYLQKYGENTPMNLGLIGNPQITDNTYENQMNNIPTTPSTTTPRSGFNWGNLGTEVGLGIANNAGNIYDLARSRETETTRYERAKANLLDPTAAIRDATDQTRRAEYNVRGASGGNAGTYLSNRVGLNAQNIINKDRIRQEYANANAGILNNNSQFNSQIQMREEDANAQNRAQTRNIKGQAIANIGSNAVSQYRDNKAQIYDQNTLDNMQEFYAALKNDPYAKAKWEKIKKGYK